MRLSRQNVDAPPHAVLAGFSQVGLPSAFLLYELRPSTFASWAVGVFAVLAVIAPFSMAERTMRVLAVGMLAGSFVSVAWTGTDVVSEGVLNGAGVIAFILAAQILGDALVRGGYDQLFRALWADITWRASWLALLGGYLLSWVFMFTSMPVMYSALYRYDETTRNARSPLGKDLGILLARAYGAAAVATPMGATVLVALSVTSVSLGDFLVVATPLSLALVPLTLIGIGGRLRALDNPGVRLDSVRAPDGSRFSYGLLVAMMLALATMIAVVSLLHVPPLAGVSSGVILIAAVWGVLGVRFVPRAPGGFGGLQPELARYGRRLSNGGLLVLAGSVFGTTLARTPIMDSLSAGLSRLDITLAGVIITIIIVIALRVVGMPPPAIVLVAGPALVQAVPLEPQAMALLLVVAGIFGFLVSPASLTSAMVSSLTGWSPVEVSLARQLPFVALAGALSCGYVMLIS
ncbi:MAG: hypothetical protein ACRDJ2_14700 [Actinomycetota bacterium]